LLLDVSGFSPADVYLLCSHVGDEDSALANNSAPSLLLYCSVPVRHDTAMLPHRSLSPTSENLHDPLQVPPLAEAVLSIHPLCKPETHRRFPLPKVSRPCPPPVSKRWPPLVFADPGCRVHLFYLDLSRNERRVRFSLLESVLIFHWAPAGSPSSEWLSFRGFHTVTLLIIQSLLYT